MTLILACSPRRNGNCATAAAIVSRESGGAFPVTALADYTVAPCVSCGFCASHPGECPQAAKDGSAPLMQAIRHASSLVLIAPIYFYHVPAQLKALMDRSQTWWMAKERNGSPATPRRRAYPILIGARQTGDRLFEGSLISLRYWLAAFDYELKKPLTLYGLDGARELAETPEKINAVREYASQYIFAAS